jgi:hypothetical protein
MFTILATLLPVSAPQGVSRPSSPADEIPSEWESGANGGGSICVVAATITVPDEEVPSEWESGTKGGGSICIVA